MVLATATVGGVVHAAIRDEEKGTGRSHASAAVFVVRNNRRDGFGHKAMDEAMGPRGCDCPPRILRPLPPVEDLPRPGSAADRRARVVARHAARAAAAAASPPTTSSASPREVASTNGCRASAFRVTEATGRRPRPAPPDRPGMTCRPPAGLLADATAERAGETAAAEGRRRREDRTAVPGGGPPRKGRVGRRAAPPLRAAPPPGGGEASARGRKAMDDDLFGAAAGAAALTHAAGLAGSCSTLALFDAGGAFGAAPAAPAPVVAAGPATDDETEAGPTGAAGDAPAIAAAPGRPRGENLRLAGADRPLARGWRARAAANVEAVRLARAIEAEDRAPTPDEQLRLLCFTGFGATELAQSAFPLPGASGYREGWEALGCDLAAAVAPEEFAALRRATQYAHYTPEAVGRALWAAALRLGFAGGRVLEPGCGTGLLLALAPGAVAGRCRFTGVEACPVTARIARLAHPEARVRCEDYTRSRLGGGFDLALGNPPFSRRVVRGVGGVPPMALHDHFVAASVARLRPGGVALFVTSTGTLDKGDPAARRHLAGMADLLAAVRLPLGAFRATAGTDVVVDVVALRRRAEGEAPPASDPPWIGLAAVPLSAAEGEEGAPETAEVNAWFAEHPEAVLGRHVMRRGVYGPGLAYAVAGDLADLEARLTAALLGALPAGVMPPPAPDAGEEGVPEAAAGVTIGTAAEGATVKEGSYLVGANGALRQVIDGAPRPIAVRTGRGGEGIPVRDAAVIRGLVPVRDAVRAAVRAQAEDRPWATDLARLRVAYQSFVRRHGPINRTDTVVATDRKTGEETVSHRRPNLAPFADDPDCWLVASVEDYDPDTGLATTGPIFRGRVVAPPAEPVVAGPADALAVTLAETGRVDLDRIGELLDLDEPAAVEALGALVFRNPRTEAWETADAYLSGPVRAKLAAARAAASADPAYARNAEALLAVQPEDLRPSDISARLGAPWIPRDVVEAFAAERMGTAVAVLHNEALAAWTVRAGELPRNAAGTSEWGTPRRDAGLLLSDALNGATPAIHDTVVEGGVERRVLNPEATEAAKEKLQQIRDAFAAWVWTDPDRADRLAAVYNARYNDLRPRAFDGSHLALPGASRAVTLRPHQKRAVWRIVASGSTYVAHVVGSGKTKALAAAVMEQRRLGLVSKPMIVVPGHTLAQWACEFLQLYPLARVLVADEANFTREKRGRFLARAATAGWDAVVITHAAFRFIAVPAAFETALIEAEIGHLEAIGGDADDDDRTTRKRVEARKEGLADRLEALRGRRDDMITIAEMGIDQILVDEAQEFRKLRFQTCRTNLKGVDPDGSARAWDLWVKSRWVETRNPGRALVQASGTPITNTLGEMFTLLRFQAEGMLRERGLHEFDAWAAAFGETRTELELQPSGAYRPVERFSAFVNVPELVDLFRTVADVVLADDLRGTLSLPRVRGGARRLVTAPATEAFRAHQEELAARIRAIEERRGRRPRPGDDILLAVITDGRHAAIDLRLVWPHAGNEEGSKLNLLVREVHRIWAETRGRAYPGPDGRDAPIAGATQMVFSDLGTEAAAATRGFSAYRWIRDELVRLGVPASEIAFAQDFKKARDKARLQEDMRAGRVRVAVGSSDVMGTGVNVQNRLVGLHHLDVPWLPSQIAQREGRIERQGNLNEEVEVLAYATLGSMDATMWQANERKARFIAAALSGDRSVRHLDDDGGADAASQFALAKAIASGDGRLMRKAGLEAEIARLRRRRAAHHDDQHAVRRRIAEARGEVAWAVETAAAIRADLARREPTRGDLFRMEVAGRATADRKAAGASLLSKLRAAALEGTSVRDWTVGRIGGFALRAGVRPNPSVRGAVPHLAIVRGAWEERVEVEDDLTPAGLVARLEHLLGRFEDRLAEVERRGAAAAARLPGYEALAGAPFALEAELDDHLARLAALDADLAQARGAPPPG